jgi:hypothetical protein
MLGVTILCDVISTVTGVHGYGVVLEDGVLGVTMLQGFKPAPPLDPIAYFSRMCLLIEVSPPNLLLCDVISTVTEFTQSLLI